MARHPLRKSLDVHDDVGKFRHASSPSGQPVYRREATTTRRPSKPECLMGRRGGVVMGSAVAGKMHTDAEE
jgi:hypothetical protein